MVRKHSSSILKSTEFDLNGEQFFKRAFAHAAIGLALVDLEGRFVYTNAAYTNITGYSAEELKHIKISSLMFPEDAKTNAVLRNDMLSGKIPGYVIEKRYIRKDGKLVWVKSSLSLAKDDQGNPVRIVGLTEDIDKRREAEEALMESESRFRFMAEHMPPKVFTAKPNGAINYLSPQWVNYTGLAFSDMDYRAWAQTVHPDDREANMRAWMQSVKTGEPFYFEHRLRRNDGVYRWHVSRAYALRNTNDEVIEWIGSDTDIEELHQSRDLQNRLEILAKQREQLISMNKLKDDFIMLASHQLRTPATIVKQYTGMLLEGIGDPITDSQRDLLQYAYDNNERQIKIVDDLLRVARIDAGQVTLSKSSCDLVQFISEIVNQKLNGFNDRQQSVIFKPCQETIVASLDTRLMQIVLENLLDNASKYSSPGKRTTIVLEKYKDYFIIEVIDKGIGIRKVDQKLLFQKFSRITNPFSETVGGTGLGLYWSRKIVELHGGKIDVMSAYRQGSTFSIQLPVV